MAAKKKFKRGLPGDRQNATTDSVTRMIRVNHAGEYGARRIYQGQLAILGSDPKLRKILEHMAEQEEAHLAYFENEIVKRKIRPTALHPLWHAAGYALGALTARISPEAAMACTVAVETVISEHYGQQIAALKKNPKEKKLLAKIRQFKAEEEEHHDIGIDENAEQAVAYQLLTKLIMSGSKLAIEIAKRI